MVWRYPRNHPDSGGAKKLKQDGEKEIVSGFAEKSEQRRVELQKDLARRSTNGEHIIAEKSGHNIQLDQPELVVESIRRVIAAAGRKDKKLSRQ